MGTFGFRDAKGHWVVEPTLMDARPFCEGYAAVVSHIYWGYIDTRGKLAFGGDNFTYQSAGDFSNGHALVLKDSLMHIINTKGKVLSTITGYDIVWPTFEEGLVLVNRGGQRNPMGLMAGQPDIVYGQSGFLDLHGNVVVPLEAYAATAFSHGLAGLATEEGWGYINPQGDYVIAPIYQSGGSFKEGLAVVVKDNKFGFINPQGQEVIPCTYDYAESFTNGKAHVVQNNRDFYIDKP